MKITLTGYELEDALKAYFQLQFNKQVDVSIDDSQEVTASIKLGSLIQDEFDTEVEDKPKQRKTRKSKVVEPEVHNEEVTEDVPTSSHYANLPELTKEEREHYIAILKLINNNPLNKNKDEIYSLTKEMTSNLTTVLHANTFYQEWLKLTTLEEISEPSEPEVIKKEVDDSPDALNSIIEDITNPNEKDKLAEDVVIPKKGLFSSTQNVTKSGTIFSAGQQSQSGKVF